jgi:TolB-like protein/tetratricopeptide (TPR) repeat protein
MDERAKQFVRIDLAQFKLHIRLKPKTELTLHFDSPSRKFYLSVIALVVNEMKKLGQITSIPLEAHTDQLTLLNETIGDSAGSSENLIPRIYRKWKDVLPDLENAPLFKVAGRKKEEDGTGKTYRFSELEKDTWANLFDYKGSEEHVRLKFSIDKLEAGLDDVVILYEDARDKDAWERFISSLKEKTEARAQPAPAVTSPQEPPAALPVAQESFVRRFRHRHLVLIASLAVAVGIVAFMLWHVVVSDRGGNLASKSRMAFPLPDKPSIAVLPLANMSDDPEQEYLSDGLAEEIINGLSKCPYIFVIARNSTFTYKGKPVKVRQVAEELGVRYVLEGSLRKAGDKVRITVQLIDALTGQHLLSERYDRELKDVLVMQDEITMKILDAVQVKLTAGEDARLRAKDTKNLEAYLKLMQARQYLRSINREKFALAGKLAEEAIALDPRYSAAYATLCFVQLGQVALGASKNPRETLEQGVEFGKMAIALDDSSALPHANLARIYSFLRKHDEAIAEAERAVSLDPNSSYAYTAMGFVLEFAGRHREAISFFDKSLRLSPMPIDPNTLGLLGLAYRHVGQYEDAVATEKKALQLYGPDHLLARLVLTGTYALMGQEKEAHAEAVEVMRIDPRFSLESYASALPYTDQKTIDDIVFALRKAGLK